MGPLPALSLLAALISAASGAMIAALNPGERANRAGALLMGSVAWWAGCEVMWQQAATASDALAWHRVAALGFVFIGPHAARFVIALHKRGLPRHERASSGSRGPERSCSTTWSRPGRAGAWSPGRC